MAWMFRSTGWGVASGAASAGQHQVSANDSRNHYEELAPHLRILATVTAPSACAPAPIAYGRVDHWPNNPEAARTRSGFSRGTEKAITFGDSIAHGKSLKDQ